MLFVELQLAREVLADSEERAGGGGGGGGTKLGFVTSLAFPQEPELVAGAGGGGGGGGAPVPVLPFCCIHDACGPVDADDSGRRLPHSEQNLPPVTRAPHSVQNLAEPPNEAIVRTAMRWRSGDWKM